MPAPRKYKNSRTFIFHAETDLFNEFDNMCHRERKSIASRLNELMAADVESKKLIQSEHNPIHVNYNSKGFDSKHKLSDEEILAQQLKDIISSMDKLPDLYPQMNKDQLARIEAATLRRNKEIIDIQRKRRRDIILHKPVITMPEPEPTTATNRKC